jgi:hypothetical protein
MQSHRNYLNRRSRCGYQQADKELRPPGELVRAADPGAETVSQFLAKEL